MFENAPLSSLGVYAIFGGMLSVRLSNDADGNVVADAVRVVETTARPFVPPSARGRFSPRPASVPL